MGSGVTLGEPWSREGCSGMLPWLLTAAGEGNSVPVPTRDREQGLGWRAQEALSDFSQNLIEAQRDGNSHGLAQIAAPGWNILCFTRISPLWFLQGQQQELGLFPWCGCTQDTLC